MSKVQDAIDHMYLNPGTTQYAASKKFMIGQSAISVALQRHNSDVAAFESVGVDKLNAIDAWFGGNPQASLSGAATKFGLTANTLRAAYRGQEVLARRKRLAAGVKKDNTQQPTDHAAIVYAAGHREGYNEAVEAAALVARALGGEHGEHVYSAIWGMLRSPFV